MFDESKLTVSLLLGELYVWTDDSDKNIYSVYSPSSKVDTIEDVNFEFLINFLNKDISKLNNSIKEAIMDVAENPLDENLTSKTFSNLTKELINWHPYFKYNPALYLGDIIVSYITRLNCYSSDFIYKLLQSILPIDIIDDLINYYTRLRSFAGLKTSNNTDINPLDELKEIQTYIIEHIPQKRPDKFRYDWNTFISKLCEDYGPICRSHHQIYGLDSKKKSIYDTMDKYSVKINFKETVKEISLLKIIKSDSSFAVPWKYNNVFEYVEPLIKDNFYRYEITSFIQYLQAILIQLSTTKYSIKYCTQCLEYYLDGPLLTHGHSEYLSQMIKIRDKVYQKVYKSYERNELPDVIFIESDLYKFHSQTYAIAIKEKISCDKYNNYTGHKNYNYKGFRTLPSILDYNG